MEMEWNKLTVLSDIRQFALATCDDSVCLLALCSVIRHLNLYVLVNKTTLSVEATDAHKTCGASLHNRVLLNL